MSGNGTLRIRADLLDPNATFVKNEMSANNDNEEPSEDRTVEDDLAQMENLGLPTGFSSSMPALSDTVREAKVIRKGEKKKYFCETCQLELNSEDTLVSHIKGTRHFKQTQALEERRKRDGGVGPSVENIIKELPSTKAISNKKIPFKLSDHVAETVEPVVGLQYVIETIACSSAEVEPHYQCTLCSNSSGANAHGMFSHIRVS